MRTNWSSPKTNIISALLSLRKARLAGYEAKLVRMRNEDCEYPIKYKKDDRDFRNYEFSIGYAASKDTIAARKDLTEFQKHLALNYCTLYGTQEAMNRYYTTGLLSKDNNKGVGRSHLVLAEDLIRFMVVTGDPRAAMYKRQYLAEGNGVDSTTHWYSFYKYKHGSMYAVKKFRRKLWVVALIPEAIKI